MKMHVKDIIGLTVETESGAVVGKVFDIDLNIETHDVVAYHVRAGTLVRQLIGSDADLEVLPVQVRSITTEKMTIADLYATKEEEKNSAVVVIPNPAQPSMSKLVADTHK